ncbi:hypothetical protein M3J09_008863 [Ascochyta lentis]
MFNASRKGGFAQIQLCCRTATDGSPTFSEISYYTCLAGSQPIIVSGGSKDRKQTCGKLQNMEYPFKP